MIDTIRKQLCAAIEPTLVDRLLKCYTELKQNYYFGKHKPTELDAAHFAEVVVRILQHLSSPDHSFTALGSKLPRFDDEVARLAQLPRAEFPDSIRLHIPRAIYAVYNIRSRRGVGHVGGDVNANVADSTFVVAACDRVMAELIRLYYTSSLDEAQRLVDLLVERKAPIVQDFDGFLKVLNPKLSVSNQVLLVLYHRGKEGASVQELRSWIKTKSSSHISTVVAGLQHKKGHIHRQDSQCFITRSGILFVETNIPLDF